MLIASPPNTLQTALLGLLNTKCLNPHSKSSAVPNSSLTIVVGDRLACSLTAEALSLWGILCIQEEKMHKVQPIQGIVVGLLALIKYLYLSGDKCLIFLCALKSFVNSW